MQAKALMKGIGIGIVAGSLVTAAIIPMDRKRLARTKAGRTLRSVGQVVEGICDSLAR
jgi:predicted small secreted protein